MKWGNADSSPRRILWTTLVVLLLACASLLSTFWDEAQARVQTQGSYCTRVGRTYNVHGEQVKEGLWWGPDGKRQEVGE